MRFSLLLSLYFLFLFGGCASVNQPLDSNTFYQRDMKIEGNGYKGDGTLVIPKSDKFKLKLEAKGALDLMTIDSCHRQMVAENAGEHGIFGNKKKAEFDYIPVAGIEDVDCDLLIGGYNIKGKHSWGYISLESPKYSLPAQIKCNGNVYNSNGTTICQSRIGLIQQIIFTEEVRFVEQPKHSIKTEDNKTIEYKTPIGENVIIFMGKNSKKFHKLVTIGYEQILIREN